MFLRKQSKKMIVGVIGAGTMGSGIAQAFKTVKVMRLGTFRISKKSLHRQ